jgi:hypothetical protein
MVPEEARAGEHLAALLAHEAGLRPGRLPPLEVIRGL